MMVKCDECTMMICFHLFQRLQRTIESKATASADSAREGQRSCLTANHPNSRQQSAMAHVDKVFLDTHRLASCVCRRHSSTVSALSHRQNTFVRVASVEPKERSRCVSRTLVSDNHIPRSHASTCDTIQHKYNHLPPRMNRHVQRVDIWRCLDLPRNGNTVRAKNVHN